MSEPNARKHRRRHISGLVLELLMIVIGVFLGAMAEQWREAQHEHALAMASLRNFRREIADNRDRVLQVHDYHVALGKRVDSVVNGGSTPSFREFVSKTGYRGVEPVDFDHTAWDLAIATQALTDFDPQLAYAISRVYTYQTSFQRYEDGFVQNALSPTTFANMNDALGLGITMDAYLIDVRNEESSLVKAYDGLLPKLDSALGGPPPSDSTATARALNSPASAPRRDSAASPGTAARAPR